jgi:hypothetical protein
LPILLGRSGARAVPDGAAGFYVASATRSGGADLEYSVQRFQFSGTRAAGWPVDGIRVCTAPGHRYDLQAVTDGLGGMLLAWYDYRPSPSGSSEIYAMRVLPDGSRAPGWAVNGTRVSDDTAPDNEFTETIAPDGMGGAYVTWEHATYLETPSYVQHLSPTGAVASGWRPYGTRLATTSSQFDPQVVEDGDGGAIVVWDDTRLYAQRFVTDGPVATLLSLVSAAAEADRVTLLWQGNGAGTTRATVYRRTEATDWRALGEPLADGSDQLRYEDRDVFPKSRYAYKLGYASDGTEQFTSETWVDVPLGAVFALEGARPNPVVSAMNASFSLANGAPATLSVIDVTGRQVHSREVGSLGAGRHVVPLDLGTRMAPGLYWLKLTQGGRSLLARAVVIR